MQWVSLHASLVEALALFPK